MAEKKVPFETLIRLLETGKIKDPSTALTIAQLEGEVGSMKVFDGLTIKELYEKQKEEVIDNLTEIRKTIKFNKEEGLDLKTESLGKIILHDYVYARVLSVCQLQYPPWQFDQ